MTWEYQDRSSEPPRRFSAQRWVASGERLVRSTVPVRGGRSTLALGINEEATEGLPRRERF